METTPQLSDLVKQMRACLRKTRINGKCLLCEMASYKEHGKEAVMTCTNSCPGLRMEKLVADFEIEAWVILGKQNEKQDSKEEITQITETKKD